MPEKRMLRAMIASIARIIMVIILAQLWHELVAKMLFRQLLSYVSVCVVVSCS
jgi:hypothetical protein